jgi:hypothetical protein
MSKVWYKDKANVFELFYTKAYIVTDQTILFWL